MGSRFVSIACVSDVGNGNESLNLSARIIRLWTLPSYNNANTTGSIEMVLMDDQGDKIHCTVTRPLVSRFQSVLVEGRCYNFYNLVTVPNIGSYRTTTHCAKFVFHLRTRVSPVERPSIPMDGLNPTTFKDILNETINPDYLIDVVGLLTSMGQPKDYERDGKTGKMVVIELTSENDKIECVLFGEYVGQMLALVRNSPKELPIVVLQLVKLKSFRGKVGLQNVIWASKILLNPKLDVVIKLKESISIEGLPSSQNISIFSESPKVGLEDDFMKNNPRAFIDFLTANEESGTFIIMGTVKNIVEDGPWWYPACRCARSVIPDVGVYFCDFCDVHVFAMTPRFKLKVEVEDPIGLVVFVLFEKEYGLLFKKSCAEVFVEFMRNPEHVRDNVHPPLFNELCEKKLLFKIETKAITPKRYNGTFYVKRVCDDSTIVEMFSLHGSENTPSKAIFTPQTTSDVGLEDICPDIDCSHAAKKIVRHTGVSFIDGCDAETVPDIQVKYFGTITPAKRRLETEFDEAAAGSFGANENEATTMETFRVEE